MPEVVKHKCDFQRNVFSEFHMGRWIELWMKFICIYEKNPRNFQFARSTAAIDFEKKRQIKSKWWYIIHPFSLCRVTWESFMVIILFADVLESPFYMTWRKSLYFEYSSDVIKILCLVNVFVTFMTGYLDQLHEVIVLNQKKIFLNYITGRFILDFLAALPWPTLFSHGAITQADLEEKKELNILTWAAFFALANALRMFEFSRHLLSYFLFGMRTYRVYRLIVVFIILFHWLTCLQCNNIMESFGYTDTLLEKAHGYTNLSDEEAYWSCCFRASSLITRISYGLYFSEQPSDVVPDIICIIFGYIFFYFVLEEVLVLDRSQTSPETKYKIQVGLLNEYMRQQEMPKEMQEKFRSLYEYRFQKMFCQENTILSTLSPRLRQEIALHTCRHLVQQSLLFRNVSRTIMAHIVGFLKHDIFLANEVLFKAGSYGDSMFFLTSGTVAVITRAGNEIAHLKDGSYFGELSMVMEDERRITSVVAVEFCDVYRLDRFDFQRVVRPHRALYNDIQHIAVERLREALAMEHAYKELSKGRMI